MTSSQVQQALSSYKEELVELGVEKLFLFGSVARKDNQETSDIDILVKFHSGKKNFDNFMNLSFRLEDILRTPVDLLTEDSLTGEMKGSILAEALPIEI
ncbi:nucleotidyltransferase [Leptospira barantonii]|uniref:Nucleotidyltransferase n=1 Tax=Leptospira barantonii TaxID=2023184 RepID=A0ABX4NJ75_9LEPT|nr:nucleotidyltransferase [Leptospira barantonii]